MARYGSEDALADDAGPDRDARAEAAGAPESKMDFYAAGPVADHTADIYHRGRKHNKVHARDAARLIFENRQGVAVLMANAKIDIVGPGEIPLVTELYCQIYRPARDADFFSRRFLGRYNPLLLVASLDERPVGFFLGFELKPSVFFAWLYGVLPDFRRKGIASQLMDAVHDWAEQHGYSSIRFECQNQHRPMLHLAIARGYDIVGLRWDPDRGSNLVIFEKVLSPDG